MESNAIHLRCLWGSWLRLLISIRFSILLLSLQNFQISTFHFSLEKLIEYYFLPPAFKLKEGNLFKRNGESSSRHAQIERRNNMHIYDDASVFENFDKSAPILWENENYDKIANKRKHVKKIKKGSKKDGGSEEEMGENEMPNTVNPNPNIYGGFPENDVWGNFELPAPETIDRLKLALKMNHHRPSYGGKRTLSIQCRYVFRAPSDILNRAVFEKSTNGF